MSRRNQACWGRLAFLGLLAAWVGCSAISELQVHYQLPPASTALEGRRIVLAVEDARPSAGILGPGAQKDFENFPGKVTFSYARYGEEGFRVGIFDVPGLFTEAFKKRLENLGMTVESGPASGAPQLVIRIEQCSLDLVDRTWKVRALYEASIMENGRLLASQSVQSQAERLKILGHKQADQVMSEVFTEIVNQVDVQRLLEEAARVRS